MQALVPVGDIGYILANLAYLWRSIMHTFGTFDAKNHLSRLLDMVERGEEVTITRNGKPVARLVVPESDAERQEKARAAAERIRKNSVGKSLGGLKIKDLIEEGRR
jgi:prevent-host-death family protein